MPTLQIRLFGDFQLLYQGEQITTGHQARLQSLLAYLILHADAPQPRRQLAFLLWPDSSESQAHSNLRKLLSSLRQILPDADQFLDADRHTIQWKPNAAYVADISELEHLLKQIEQETPTADALARADQIYRGELLPDCYDEWLLPVRQRYRQGVQQALAWLVAQAEEQREYAAGVRYAQRLLELDPLDETTYPRLMRLHALLGNRSGAVRVYRDCAALLKHELGVEPSAKTQQTYEWILNLTLGAPAQARQQPVVAERVALVGRAAEWQQLRATWQMSAQGHAHVVMISGEAGIGKTRLAEELLHWAGYHGILVARTRLYAAQGDLAYAPLTELLRADPMRTRLGTLSDIWLVELARLLPELLASAPTMMQPNPLTDNWARQRLLDALARTVLADEQPLILLFDDLQWCDQETLHWLRYLIHLAPQACLLVMGTVRPEEVDRAHPLAALEADLRRSEQFTEIALPALSQAEVSALAGQLRDTGLTPHELEQLYRETEGNPLFVVETVRAGLPVEAEGHQRGHAASPPSPFYSAPPARLPAKVYTVIRSRLMQLSAAAHELMSLAAVVGRSFTFDILAAASSQDEEMLVNSLDELWRRRVIRDYGARSYDFSHDRIREVAYTEISPTRQRWFHQQVATAIEQIHAHRLGDVCSQLAVHWELAGQLEKAILYAQQAAEMARQMYAHGLAIDYWRKALGLVRQLPATAERAHRELQILLDLGTVLKDAKGDAAPEVEAVYVQARELCRQLGDAPEVLPVVHGLTEIYRVRAEYGTAFELGEQLLALAQQYQSAQFVALACFQVGMILCTRGELATARAYFEQSILSGLVSPGYLKSQTRLAQVLWQLGYPEQALMRMQETRRLAQEPMRQTALTDLLGDLIDLQLQCGELDAAVENCAAMLALARKYELDEPLSWATFLQGRVLALQGDRTGIQQMHQALAGYLATGGMTGRAYFLCLLADTSLQSGAAEQAEAYLEEAEAFLLRTGERQWEAELYRLKGQWLLAQREADPTRAEACFLHALEIARRQQAKTLELRAAVCLSRLWRDQNRQREAAALLSEVYGWFSEGVGLRDLQEAKALLGVLS